MALFGVRAAAFAAALWAAGGCLALADPPPWAHGHRHTHSVEAVSPGQHGVLSGTVVGIDYAMGSIMVATPRGVVPLAVTPSTSIFRGAGFGSLADLARGARVSIDFSATGGHFIAQIIRVR
ncbi:MAG TPA: hypothetical protein VFE17_09410 [Candidatus Baltobacteraceae bacterium]|jgi:hypothetical protein|nr:hypothetical protein [Candidatus Baltobacteraceae bacterium]